MYELRVFSSQRGMTDIEKQGICEILSSLKKLTLWKLAKSISGYRRVTTKEKAIGLILAGSRNSTEILKKKKVSRVLIRNYLLDNYIFVDKNETKDVLIERTKMFWDMPQECREQYLELLGQPQDKMNP